MPPRQRLNNTTPAAFPASAAAPTHSTTSAASQPTSSKPNPAKGPTPTPAATSSSIKSSSAAAKNSSTDAQQILQNLWNNYVDKTTQRVKLLDVFMGFLLVLGAVQFVYCVVAGNYPFNAFLSGFSATVGQFVLTASLRMQTNPENKAEYEDLSNERAFADFVFGSLILHFFCINFIN